MGKAFKAQRFSTVSMTTLDAEFEEETIDILVVQTNGGELSVIRGAAGLLEEQRVRVLMTNCFEVDLASYKHALLDKGYVVEREVPLAKGADVVWTLARPKSKK